MKLTGRSLGPGLSSRGGGAKIVGVDNRHGTPIFRRAERNRPTSRFSLVYYTLLSQGVPDPPSTSPVSPPALPAACTENHVPRPEQSPGFRWRGPGRVCHRPR